MPSRLDLQDRLYLRAGDGFYYDRRQWLREAGAARIYLAGREPEAAETALVEARVAEFIWAGSDTLAIFEDTFAVALREPQS